MKELLRFKNEFIILALLIVMFLVGKNLMSSYSVQMQAIESKQREVKAHSDILGRWKKADAEYHSKNEKFIFSNTSEFKKFVDEQAQSQGVNISYIGPARQDKLYYEEATMSLKVMAKYKNLAGFIKLLEAKGIVVEKLIVKNTESRQGTRKGRSIELVIKVFVPKKQL
jgi:Tfp pilus assembly protein PilO